MDADGFIAWALDDSRTVEGRYTVELLVEEGVERWNSCRKIYKRQSIEQRVERKRQRALNPAYEPRYSAEDVRKAAETWPTVNRLWLSLSCHDDRPIRDLTVLRFFTQLEDIDIHYCEVRDVSVFAALPKLRRLVFGSQSCEDLRPLGNCLRLRELSLTMGQQYWRNYSHWPDVTGLEKLTELESLSLTGNLLVFGRGITWPKVRQAALQCEPLAARSVRDLPQLPACEFLTLGGVERLDGIEAFPRLRNLALQTNVRDFTPLIALDKLTCFTCGGFEPLDVSPLARLPKLYVATFNANYKFTVTAIKPRDFAPLTDAPALRELHVENCPPVEAEVRMLNSVLQPWDDVCLVEEPRPLPSTLRMIIAPWDKHPHDNDVKLAPEDNGLPDEGLRQCEGHWLGRYVAKTISAKLGTSDWGNAGGNGRSRGFSVTIEAFAVVEKLPLIIETMREVMTRLRHEHTACFMIQLKSPPPEPTAAQQQLVEQFQNERDESDYQRRCKEQAEHLERLHRYELKKQLGEEIKPEDFVPEPRASLEDETDEEESYDGEVAVKKKPDPPEWFDDEHPLADNYRLMGTLTLSEVWFMPHHRDIAIYLMGRQPDVEIPEEKKTN